VVKILSKSGDSLADMYDVQGSIAGIGELDTRELPIVHEMGGTLFSERLGGNVRRHPSGTILQSVNFDVIGADFNASLARIIGVAVFVDTIARMSFVQVSVRSEVQEREVPIFVWDAAFDDEVAIRVEDNGGGAANTFMLRPISASSIGGLPCLLTGSEQPEMINQLAFRGRSLAFGAGDVTAILVIQLARVLTTSVSSRGLPVPSW